MTSVTNGTLIAPGNLSRCRPGCAVQSALSSNSGRVQAWSWKGGYYCCFGVHFLQLGHGGHGVPVDEPQSRSSPRASAQLSRIGLEMIAITSVARAAHTAGENFQHFFFQIHHSFHFLGRRRDRTVQVLEGVQRRKKANFMEFDQITNI